MRRRLSSEENAIWQNVRGHRLGGFKFRRKEPIGDYIADFCCYSARLIVSIGTSGQEEKLQSQGWRILRCSAEEVRASLDAVLDRIWLSCVERASETADI
jgi:very-short-patch-repair endonuclease